MAKMTIPECLKAIESAHDAALKVAAALYPPGTRVGVMLSSRQRNPSPGTILGVSTYTGYLGGGTRAYLQINVEMDRYKSYRSRIQRVSPEAVRAEE